MPICKDCRHADYAHVNGECVACGCIHFESKPKRQDRQRTWIAYVSFLEWNHWTAETELKVKAQGIGGAAQRAAGLAKQARTSRRRILETKARIVPVPRSRA